MYKKPTGPYAVIEVKKRIVNYKFKVFSMRIEDRVSVFIPGFDLAFSAKYGEKLDEKIRYMTKSFFDYHLIQLGWRNFVSTIHHMGFRAPKHDLVMKNMLNKRPVDIKLKYARDVQNPAFDLKKAEEMEMELDTVA